MNGDRCTNMNHGRMNVQIKFCPSCGVSLNPQATGRCDQHIHAELRKKRYDFCHDCGKKLSGGK